MENKMNWKKYYTSPVNSNDWLHAALLWFAIINVSLNPTPLVSAMLVVWACTFLGALFVRALGSVKRAKNNAAYFEKREREIPNMGALLSKLEKQNIAKATAETDALIKRQAEETYKLLLPHVS